MLERLNLTSQSAQFPQKCSIQLKLGINRLRLHRTKKLEEGNRQKKEIAELLQAEKEQLARVKVTTVIFDDYMIEALNIVEVYCETILARAQLLSVQKVCPSDLKEAVCNIIYAAPYLAMEETTKLRAAFIKRYGKDFMLECEQNGYLNQKLVTRLQHKPPDEALINFYLSAIAKKHNIDWGIPVGTLPTTLPTPQPTPEPIHFPTPFDQQPHGPSTSLYHVGPGQFPASAAPPGGEDEVDALEARLRALAGIQTPSSMPGAIVQSPQSIPDDLDELDSMWKNTAVQRVNPALAEVDEVLSQLDATFQSVSAGRLLSASPASENALADLAAAVEALRQATGSLSSEAANGKPISDQAQTFAYALARLADLSIAAASRLPDAQSQAAALRAIRAAVESGRTLIAAAEALSASPNDPSLRDRLGKATAGVAAAVKALLYMHQQPAASRAPPATQAVAQVHSADEAARVEIMQAAQALIAAATQLHEAATGAPRRQEPDPNLGDWWNSIGDDLHNLPPTLIPPAQLIASAAGALLAAAADCQAERVQTLSSGKNYHPDPTWTEGLVSASRAVTSATFHALKLAVAVGKGQADIQMLQAALQAAAGASAQLVAASRAKADPSSHSLHALIKASANLSLATSKLVAAATTLRPVSNRPNVASNAATLTQAQAEEIEQRARILRLEQELENARGELHGLHKQRYAQGSGGRP